MQARNRLALLVALAVQPLPGCYYVQASAGQLELMNGQRPIADALADETDPERRVMLSSIAPVRAFARDVLQLRPRRAYSGYFATERRGLTYVVLACERTRFEPHTWWFPVAGTVAYKSHFDEAEAEAEAAELRAEGYDTWIGYSRAYSTLGWFRDPVVTTMMRGGLLEFIEILIHEMTHVRLYVPGQTDFNEQLASFVGRVGTGQLLAARRHAGTGLLQRFHDGIVRRQAFEAKVREAIATLEKLYASGQPEAHVLRERQLVFDRLSAALERLAREAGREPDPQRLVMNNARLLQWRRYSQDADYLQDMWTRAQGSWPRFWQLVEIYAQEQLGDRQDTDAG